jgi:hypothetical protein
MSEENNLPAEKWLPEYDPILDEEAVLQIFTTRVEEMLEHSLDLLLSSLYRLDVEEDDIQLALRSQDVPPARGIAKLILDRQKARLMTKQEYKKQNPDNWDWDY